MQLYHFSDLHGDLRVLAPAGPGVDALVCTGDFFPNYKGPDQRAFQRAWFFAPNELLDGDTPQARMMDLLAGRPLLWVPGNHDWEDLVALLPPGAAQVVSESRAVVLRERVFAGFRFIPRALGKWQGEIEQGRFPALVHRVFAQRPHVLVTHAPPYGILDGADGGRQGVRALVDALRERPHRVTHHLFGHIHEHGGRAFVEGAVTFVNSAQTWQQVDIP